MTASATLGRYTVTAALDKSSAVVVDDRGGCLGAFAGETAAADACQLATDLHEQDGRR